MSVPQMERHLEARRPQPHQADQGSGPASSSRVSARQDDVMVRASLSGSGIGIRETCRSLSIVPRPGRYLLSVRRLLYRIMLPSA